METLKTLGDFRPDLPRPAVMCTLVRVRGSAPQQPGARMWVSAERFAGTLGGGELERRVLEDARALLAAGAASPALKEYVLCKDMGQCCGGRVEIFLEPVPRRKAVHLFGGGHVGRAVASVLAGTALDVTLVDPRPEWASREGLPEGIAAVCADPLAYARERRWEAWDAACVFTHSHELDYALVKLLLPLPLGYLGLIGSAHKGKVFLSRLAREPLPAGAASWEALWEERLRFPIGKPLPSKNPKVIAVGVAAELLDEWALAPAPSAKGSSPA